MSALPVLDDQGGLVDIYARADITALAAANAYNRLQWEDVTVGQALRLGAVGDRQTVSAFLCRLSVVSSLASRTTTAQKDRQSTHRGWKRWCGWALRCILAGVQVVPHDLGSGSVSEAAVLDDNEAVQCVSRAKSIRW